MIACHMIWIQVAANDRIRRRLDSILILIIVHTGDVPTSTLEAVTGYRSANIIHGLGVGRVCFRSLLVKSSLSAIIHSSQTMSSGICLSDGLSHTVHPILNTSATKFQ